MPFLRFARDKRGIETTSLLYAVRRHGKNRPTLLYWFRTPPNVRVGRAAIDEDAIRQLEETHPEMNFDWSRILHANADAVPSPVPTDQQRGGGGRSPKRGPETERQRPSQHGSIAPPAVAKVAETRVGRGPEHPSAADAAEGLVSHDDLARLRARYSELLARISERVSDPQRAEAMRLQAEALNPDAWVTTDEVARGLAEAAANEQRIRDQLGPRRRSRRGGARRRKKKGQGQGGPSSAPAA